ncbi:hypothetical protein Ciccas_004024 [Cichlidogyrus casuarinus]|uniref:Phosphodiesterase n=1 Tax=Cichlidogyrus casuarinus TaxID=1844966 RepID=A0ABD2QCR4_9PLAT
MIPRSALSESQKESMTAEASSSEQKLLQEIEQAVLVVEQSTSNSPIDTTRSSLGQPGNPHDPSHRISIENCRSVWREFLAHKNLPPTFEQWAALRSVNFNNWQYSDADLIRFAKFMFVGPSAKVDPELSEKMAITKACRIFHDKLDTWLCLLYRFYNRVPFHNFKHAFMVLQMMYATISITKLYDYLPSQDLFILMFSALCHDLDHPGFNNTFQVNSRSRLATVYNDHSPLENHHCFMAFVLCRASNAVNILSSFSNDESIWIRRAVISCILSTDMSKHAAILKDFRQKLPEFYQAARATAAELEEATIPIDTPESIVGIQRLLGRHQELRLILMSVLIKICDISNELREVHVSERWLDCLLEEFFQQAETEHQMNLPVAPFMDPKLVTKSTSQIGFIRSSLMPLIEDLGKLFPALSVSISNNLTQFIKVMRKIIQTDKLLKIRISSLKVKSKIHSILSYSR